MIHVNNEDFTPFLLGSNETLKQVQGDTKAIYG